MFFDDQESGYHQKHGQYTSAGDLDPQAAMEYREPPMNAPTQAAALCCPAANDQPDLRPVEGDEADEELASLAKAIGHPARVKILRLLVRRNACICAEIVDELPLAQSTVSSHLKVLKDVGLIRGDVDGPRVCYCIEPRALRRLKALIGGL
jgi:DNA-binding transcriptional ArsR family regulator